MTPGAKDLWFLPLGGCGEIGMNLNLYGHDGAWLMVDCGITFERDSTRIRPRVQTPDPRFIVERKDALAGIVLTHAHEDHIGALPLLWERFPVPVYTTPFTAEVLRRKAAGRGGRVPSPLIECLPGEEQTIGPFDVRWLPITHSTPDTCALHIRCAAGSLLHTADWKIDAAPQVGPAFSSALFSAAGDSALDAVICDSTNAVVSGHSVSESAVRDGLLKAVAGCEGRVVVACFASNIARLHSLFYVAEKTRRYLGLLGRSLQTMHSAALSVGLLERSKRLIETGHLGYLPKDEVLIVATGSQGEHGAALQRLAAGSHPQLELESGDTVILSSRVIPGNEESVERLLQRFRAQGIQIIDADSAAAPVHASGHPCADELASMYQWSRPRLAVPVHGEQRHMQANARIARANGAAMALTGSNGDLFYLAPEPGMRRKVATVGRLEQDEEGRLSALPAVTS
ncbi:metallo-beta-lactamase family protein [gamma proteobacterium NOR5-3]|nr:metallo-beta-lactamase family protein [gamma proteobacterium NOR5-3]